MSDGPAICVYIHALNIYICSMVMWKVRVKREEQGGHIAIRPHLTFYLMQTFENAEAVSEMCVQISYSDIFSEKSAGHHSALCIFLCVFAFKEKNRSSPPLSLPNTT